MQRIPIHSALRNLPTLRQLNCRVVSFPYGHPGRLWINTIKRSISAPAQPTLLSPKFTVPWLKALALRDHPSEASSVEQGTKEKSSTLTPRRMTDSYSSYTLEFGKDEWLVDAYVNSTGQLRLGTIFMDLDALAGVVAYKHAGEGQTIVTAAVDRISLLYHPTSFCDMELRGMVTWTSGRSSMEISLEVVALKENRTILTCQFTMVALDPVTKKATAVNPLIVETAEENRIFARGEERNRFKKALASASLEKQAPNEEESNLIHTMWRESQRYKGKYYTYPGSGVEMPENIVYMADTQIQTTQVMQPQYRNRHVCRIPYHSLT
ncbi:hypothetical protein TWF506_004207 [Arthrobotrys conoides]|uniref:HotDog ACOT-type domain-containing protein n=1 Tax=Arthrobotrys conoides TaxID=74498 RepID=A0AAN8RPE0_9PEZI